MVTNKQRPIIVHIKLIQPDLNTIVVSKLTSAVLGKLRLNPVILKIFKMRLRLGISMTFIHYEIQRMCTCNDGLATNNECSGVRSTNIIAQNAYWGGIDIPI